MRHHILLADICKGQIASQLHLCFVKLLFTSVGSNIDYQEYFSRVLLTKVHYGCFFHHGKVVAVHPLHVRSTVRGGPLGRTPAHQGRQRQEQGP